MGPWSTALTPSAQDLTFRVPRVVSEDVSGDLSTAESGTIGIAVDGVVIFAETSSKSWNGTDLTGNGNEIWNADAWVEEGYSMDDAGGGHANAVGTYHNHATPFALYTEAASGHSPIVGWALDGVPIYGPYGYDEPLNENSSIVRIETSYQLRNITQRHTLPDGTSLAATQYGPDVTTGGEHDLGTFVEDKEYIDNLGHLDEHNGRWCKTPEYPNGIYAYFITIDENNEPAYPYIIGPEYYGETTKGSGGYASIDATASKYDESACTTTNLDPTTNKNLKVYPNPSSDIIYLEKECEWTLTDLNGSTLLIGNGNEINLTSLAKGSYLLVYDGSSQLIIKN